MYDGSGSKPIARSPSLRRSRSAIVARHRAVESPARASAAPIVETGAGDVIVVRTFSKAFGLASARVGYALADLETAAELNERQEPAPLSTLVGCARACRARGRAARRLGDDRRARATRERAARPRARAAAVVHELRARPGRARAGALRGAARAGLRGAPVSGAIRITVHRPEADDRLLEALAAL